VYTTTGKAQQGNSAAGQQRATEGNRQGQQSDDLNLLILLKKNSFNNII
jgi:hypothetical protein